jgi:hypothetical protein
MHAVPQQQQHGTAGPMQIPGQVAYPLLHPDYQGALLLLLLLHCAVYIGLVVDDCITAGMLAASAAAAPELLLGAAAVAPGAAVVQGQLQQGSTGSQLDLYDQGSA